MYQNALSFVNFVPLGVIRVVDTTEKQANCFQSNLIFTEDGFAPSSSRFMETERYVVVL